VEIWPYPAYAAVARLVRWENFGSRSWGTKLFGGTPSSSVMLDLAIAGEREMQSDRLPFLAVIALWLLPIQAIAAERPVLGQGNISCSLWLEGLHFCV